jgi:hypothetical protein
MYWNLATDTKINKYESITDTPNAILYGFPQWWMKRCYDPHVLGQARYDCFETVSWKNSGDMKFHSFYDLD